MPAARRHRPGRGRRDRLLLRPGARARPRATTSPPTSGRACARCTSRRAPRFLATLGLDPGRVRFVGHHVAHAASAHLAAPHASSAVLVVDGRGESASHLAGHARADGSLEVLAAQRLPHSLGLLYEELTAHLGFRRSSDEYKVMAMASYGQPRFLDALRELVDRDGRRRLPHRAGRLASATRPRCARATTGPRRTPTSRAACRSASRRSCSSSPRWLHERTGERCADHGRRRRAELRGQFAHLARGPVRRGLGAARRGRQRHRARAPRCTSPTSSATPCARWAAPTSAARGATTSWPSACAIAKVAFERPDDVAEAIADVARRRRRRRLVPGRERVRPARARAPQPARRPAPRGQSRAPERRQGTRAVPAGGADGPRGARGRPVRRAAAEPVHALHPPRARRRGAERIPAVVHVDGTARIQTVSASRRAARGAHARRPSSGAPACPSSSTRR